MPGSDIRVQWSERVSDTEAARRAGGRRRYNAVRQFRAVLRRRKVARLYLEFGGGYGCQAEIARRLGVHPSTVSRDLAILRRGAMMSPRCPFCGHRYERIWLELDETEPAGQIGRG